MHAHLQLLGAVFLLQVFVRAPEFVLLFHCSLDLPQPALQGHPLRVRLLQNVLQLSSVRLHVSQLLLQGSLLHRQPLRTILRILQCPRGILILEVLDQARLACNTGNVGPFTQFFFKVQP